MPFEAVFEELVNAIMSFDAEKVYESTKKALDKEINPVEIVQKGITKGLRIVGDKFSKGEFFLMHLVAAGEAVKKVMDELINPELEKRAAKLESIGKVVIGTVEGDIHDIGKNIVASMLVTAGFEVYDIGKDIPSAEFVKKAREVDADIIGASALLSTTMPAQREIVELLRKEGLKDKIKVMVGGAPATEEWAKEIGADGYAENAIEAVNVAKKLLKIEP
ncbi:MAG: B12-binding domain-containing protein [Promethearchaeota archaeon]